MIDIFSVIIGKNKEEAKEEQQLEKLKSIPRKDSSDLNEEEKKSLSKAIPEKFVMIFIDKQEDSLVRVKIDLLDEKEVKKEELVLGTEGAGEIELIKIFEELIIPNYKKWKEVKTPNVKDSEYKTVSYILKQICEYLWKKSLVGIFESGYPITMVGNCGNKIINWIKAAINDDIKRSYMTKEQNINE